MVQGNEILVMSFVSTVKNETVSGLTDVVSARAKSAESPLTLKKEQLKSTKSAVVIVSSKWIGKL